MKHLANCPKLTDSLHQTSKALPAVFVRQVLLVTFVLLVVFSSTRNCFSQRSSSANSRQIDPVRVGDNVEVKSGSTWYLGTVLSYDNGTAKVEYTWTGTHKLTRSFADKDIRFPDGEGHWMLWKDKKGKLKVEARYIARDETEVMIREADGTEHTLAIADLSLQLKKLVRQTPIPQDASEVLALLPFRVGDEVQVKYWNEWYEGTIISITPEQAEVQYTSNQKPTTRKFDFDDIRFANGESGWSTWKDTTGKFEVRARYLSRTKTHVKLLKENGKQIEIPIAKLLGKIRRYVNKLPILGEENLIGGVNPLRVDDKVQVKHSWDVWYDGVVIEVQPGRAMVEFDYKDKVTKVVFELENIRFPNQESHWLKWKTKDGQFEVGARFLRRDQTHAVLLKENRKEIRIETAKLSTKLAKLVNESVATTEIPEWIEFDEGRSITSVLPNLPDFTQFTLETDQLTPKAQPMPNAGGFGFSLKNGDKITMSKPIGDGDWILVGTGASEKFKGRGMSRLFWVNPVTSELVNGPGFSRNESIVDYSAEQQRLVTSIYIGKNAATWGGYCVYKLAPRTETAEPEFRWLGSRAPKADDQEKKKSRPTYNWGPNTKNLLTRQLIGTDRFLRTGSGFAQLTDLKTRSSIYQVNDVTDGYIAMHPSGKYFLFEKKSGGLALLEFSTGKQLAFEPAVGDADSFGFSDDGTKITAIANKTVWIWDLAQSSAPKQYQANNIFEYGVAPQAGGSMRMVSDRWIWIGKYLYDLEKEMVVWGYAGPHFGSPGRFLSGNRLLATFIDSSRAMLGTTRVPHAAAISSIDPVAPDTMIMLDRGKGVKIEAGGGPIKKHLLDLIEANGWVEDSQSKVILKGTAGRGETETRTYKTFGSSRFGGGKKVTKTATPWVQNFAVRYGDEETWRSGSSSGGLGMVLTNKEIEGKANSRGAVSYSHFENLKVPARMVYPHFRFGIGESTITSSGFKDKVFGKKESAEINKKVIPGSRIPPRR